MTRISASDFVTRARSFLTDLGGGVAMTFAVSTPAVLGATALAVDYSNLGFARGRLQELADSAALGAARELRLAQGANSALVVAQNFVNANARTVSPNGVTFDGAIASDKSSVTVTLSSSVPLYVAQAMGMLTSTVGAKATAKLTNGPPLCVVGLDQNSNWGIALDQSARLMANGCTVYSNSPKPNGLASQSSSLLQSSLACVVGGVGGGSANFSPQPKTGCPVLRDPLASRATPSVGACDPTKSNTVISSGSVSLYPGVYCGGLRVTGSATVSLMAGTYVMKDGDLRVDTGATLSGTYVGFYFTGDSKFRFDSASNLNLSAPKDGVMAGMLFFQNPNADKATFQLDSNNASNLLGTIYLPKGDLQFGGNQPVAQNSAFTIIVANTVYLHAGPTMYMNTNYAGTDVPVPDNLGSNSGGIALTN